ncbi:TonB-dependent receptor [Simiduia curdlanivorans]|uniref:TonB-dependent receptor n=1 Tax=Simiduia curdlanivorans TaxID=1492769 RepID=A0ABV8V0F0_9GAMM|nr:TonB-dependent receptor [Simiduia curdlanivorans]MDN3639127.1 TonB-dependent receptor [Simiduia curdlanivorans]
MLPATSFAQDAFLEEIIVTASARAQAIEDIPYNISAVQGSDIEQQNIVDATDLMRTIPGISVVDRGQRNAGVVNSMVIRGINVDNGANGDIGLSAVPTVASYVDQTPLFANFLLKDIDRVEVLRGPQGTLYGSGALGGTVRYLMNKPSTEGFDASVAGTGSMTEGSDGQNYSADGMINLPLGDTVALRVSVGTVQNAGVIDYVNLYELADGRPVVAADDGSCKSAKDSSLSATEVAFNGSCYTEEKDADSVSIDYAHAALRFEPSDNFNLQLSLRTQRDEVDARRSTTSGTDYNGNAYGDYESGSTMLEGSERDVQLASLDMEWEMGFATLTSNTSSYTHEGNGWRDNTSLWVTGNDWFDSLYPGNPRPVAYVNAGYDEEALVQEFRLVSNADDSVVDWVAGVYYMDQDKSTTNTSYLLGLNEYSEACTTLGAACIADGAWWLGAPLSEIDFLYDRKETFTDLAVYGELTWHLSDVLRVTGGLRWFDNELTNSTAMDFPLFEGVVVPYEDFPAQEEDGVLSKLNASWDMSENIMLYATFSQGFRRGGANAVPASGFFAELNPETVMFYKADRVDNYELGIKGTTDRLRYSADIYYVDWKDPQLNTATTWWGFFIATNGESAKTQGVEAEVTYAITDNLNLNAGYAFTSAELTADLISPQSGAVLSEDGHRLPSTAEHVVTLSLDHHHELSNGLSLNSRIAGYYQSDSINSVQDTSIQETFDGFSLWNGSVALQAEKWTLSLYARNIFNEAGVTGSYPSAYMSTDTNVFENYYGNNQRNYLATPRTLGLSAKYYFR